MAEPRTAEAIRHREPQGGLRSGDVCIVLRLETQRAAQKCGKDEAIPSLIHVAEPKQLADVKPGDFVVRDLYGIRMRLQVTEVTSTRIRCGPYEFCRLSGAEIDLELGLGPGWTCSFIIPE